jgi:hypothetical protein
MGSTSEHPVASGTPVSRYNEVDCKVMMEIICYLRAYH